MRTVSLVALLALAASASGQSGPGFSTILRSTGSAFTPTLFAPGPGYSFPNGQWLAGDWNGDGRRDLLHAVQGTNYVHPWMATPAGDFAVSTFSPWAGYAVPNGTWLAADVNGDGRTDIIHPVNGRDYIHSWLSNGNGTFNVTTFRPWTGYAIPNGVWLAGDITGNGRADIVHVVNGADYVHTWRSNGNGTYVMGTFRPWPGYRMPNGVWLMGDLNGDGRQDLFHAVQGTDYAHAWLSNGDGTFRVSTFRPWTGYGIPNGEWLIGDINGDGRADIVHAVAGTNYVHSWRSNGNGTFTMGTQAAWAGYAIPNGQWMIADVNGDGRADLIHAVRNSDVVHPWISNGAGGFTIGTSRTWSGYPNGALPSADHAWLVGDWNGDRRADLFHAYPLAPLRPLRIARHTGATLGDADADRILNEMTRVAFRNDNAGDRTCPVRFTRNGGVTVFAVPNAAGAINNQADFNAVIGTPGEVKLVRQINWCGQAGTNIIGCAPVPGGSLAAVRIGADEGILWLHERAHNMGRGHRNDTSAVMNPFIAATALGLDQAECTSLR